MSTLRNITLRITIVVATMLAAQSCIYVPHNYYVYQPHNVPQLRDSNEVALDVSFTTNYELVYLWPFYFDDNQTLGFNINAAYSPIKHLGVMGSYNLYSYNGIRANNGELAVGFYQPYSQNMIFDVYGGCRVTNQMHNFSDSGSVKLFMTNTFVQPSIGFSYAPVDLAFAMRLGYAQYHSINNHVGIAKESKAVQWLCDNPRHFMLEPSLTFRAGYKRIKGQLQFAYSIPLSTTPPREMPTLNSITLSIGIHFAIGRSYP